MTNELRKFWANAEKEILRIMERSWNSELGAFYLNDVSIYLNIIQRDYYDLLMKYNRKQYNTGRKLSKLLLNQQKHKVSIKSKVQFDNSNLLFKPRTSVSQAIENKVFTSSQSTMNRVDNSIMKIISEGHQEGKGVDEVSRMVRDRFGSLKTWESDRIARTEINTANNLGNFESYEDLGVEYHMWWTAEDERVRGTKESDQFDHLSMHGKIVQVGNYFSNNLLFPGDTGGELGEWINCRCTTVPFLMPLGMMAPPGVTEFTEGELVEIPGFEKPTLEEALEMLKDGEPLIEEPTIELPSSEPQVQFPLSKEDQALYEELKELADNNELGFLNRKTFEELENQMRLNELWTTEWQNLERKEYKEFKKLYGKLEEKLNLKPSKEFFAKPEVAKPKVVREKTKWDKNVEKLDNTATYKVDGKTFTNHSQDASETVQALVRKQNIQGEGKEVANIWSGSANRAMNAFNRGAKDIDLGDFNGSLARLKETNKKLYETINGLSPAQCLQEDITVWRGVRTEWINFPKFKVGEINEFPEFISTSFSANVAEGFAEYTAQEGYLFKIHAPVGTKGLALDSVDIGIAGAEEELLLNKGQRYITKSIDKENKIIELLLLV